jgi:hypothetical protein
MDLASTQHDVVAVWQLQRIGMKPGQIQAALRGLRRIHRGVCALGALTDLGWFMAAALAMGPTGVVSHSSALMLLKLRPYQQKDIHVSFTGGGREPREGLTPHRRTTLDWGHVGPIPVTSPTQSLRDADLQPHELYRALEEAEERRYLLTLPLNDVVRLKQAVRGRTRSDAEARFLLLCHDHGLPLPLVNHHLNGIETDFHWPDRRLVVEVDGWEYHKERPQFEEDRRRGLVHAAAGYTVVRASALQVEHAPHLVAGAVRTALS